MRDFEPLTWKRVKRLDPTVVSGGYEIVTRDSSSMYGTVYYVSFEGRRVTAAASIKTAKVCAAKHAAGLPPACYFYDVD